MRTSEIDISNLALAAIGEEAIRDFSEGNTRARICGVFYSATRDFLLGQFSWPFANSLKKLNKLAEPSGWMPPGLYAYALPSDCHQPLDLWPEGSRLSWEVRGQELITNLDSAGLDIDVVLSYVRYEINPSKFSAQFVNLLAIALAVRICPQLTQDKELVKTLMQQHEVLKAEAWGTDAAIGNIHLHNDNNPLNDAFVDPDMSHTGGAY